MTWAEYKALVDEQLSVEANRRGLESFRDRALRNSVLDLQRFIRQYRKGHTTTYVAADLTTITHAMLGTLPTGAIPEAFYIQHVSAPSPDPTPDAKCQRNRLDFSQWINRQSLICSDCRTRYAYALSPDGRQFLIHPVLNDYTNLLLVWDGLKQDFDDADEVPFPSEASEASAAYMMHRIILQVDKNIALAAEQCKLYAQKRLSLFRDAQETQDAEKPDQEYGVSDAPPTPDGSISSWADLAALTTVGLTLPVTKFWVESATLLYRVTVLKAGTDATDTANGIQRPNDYADPGNAVVWYQAGSGA